MAKQYKITVYTTKDGKIPFNDWFARLKDEKVKTKTSLAFFTMEEIFAKNLFSKLY